MAVDELITEIERNQRIVDEANGRIRELTKQLRESPFDGYDMIPVKTAADKVGMSICWVYNQINSGRVKSVKKGAKTLVSASEVMALDDSRRKGM